MFKMWHEMRLRPRLGRRPEHRLATCGAEASRVLDQLGRSLRDPITMLDDLRAHGVKFHSLTEAIDTTAPTGRALGN